MAKIKKTKKEPKRFPGAGKPEASESIADEKDYTEVTTTMGDPVDDDTSTGIKKPADESLQDPDQELNDEIDANFNLAWDAMAEWIEEAKEDVEFKTGNQWAEDDRTRLTNERRPCMTFNKVNAIVKLITGHFIQNSSRIQVSPEGGEDQKFSDIADRLLDHIDEHAQIEFNLGYLFNGGETTGRAFLELYLDYDKDPIFGHLKSIYHGRPGIILPDPRGNCYDLNQDCEFVFKLTKKTKAQLKDMFPDKTDLIDDISMDTENPSFNSGKEGDRNNYGISKHSTTVGLHKYNVPGSLNTEDNAQYHCKEYWRYKRVKKFFVYFVNNGDMPEFDTKEEAEAEIENRKQQFLAEGNLIEQWGTVIRERQRKEMHVAIRCGGKILVNDKSNFEPYYSGYPFIQFIAGWTPEAEESKDAYQGIVRGLKDPQREKNKARSQFLHIINTSANSGFIVDSDSMTKQEMQDLKNFGSTPGVVIKKKTGTTVQKIEAASLPVAQQVREKAANDDFTEVSGINADLLAMDKSANPSGKAIALRIRQGLTILEPDFRNFRYTKKILGTAILQMLPTLFDAPKVEKVLGVKYMQANEIDNIFIKSFLVQIEDLRYNVRVAEQGDTKTMREETFEDLMQMLEKGMQIPFEVMSEYMTLPNKVEVLKKVQAFQQQQAANAQAIEAAKSGKAPGALALG